MIATFAYFMSWALEKFAAQETVTAFRNHNFFVVVVFKNAAQYI